MIDQKVRSQGVGGSEIAAIVGLDLRRDAFAVYADKLGLIEREPPTQRMKFGKRLERVIADAYAEEAAREIAWCDQTAANRERPWQIYTVDAFVLEAHLWAGILDAKNVALDQMGNWGEAGTNAVPDYIALQMHWYCSAAGLPWADVAALFGGNDLRIYRIHRDADIEAVLLAEAEKFWHVHVLARNPPPIGCSPAASAYLKQRFPRNTQALRSATVDELALLAQLKQAKEEHVAIEREKESLENAVKLAIGEADGLTLPGKGKVTWLKNADTMGVDWETIARVGLQEEDLQRLIPQHQIITRHGPRVLRCTWPKADSVWIPQELPAGEPVMESR